MANYAFNGQMQLASPVAGERSFRPTYPLPPCHGNRLRVRHNWPRLT